MKTKRIVSMVLAVVMLIGSMAYTTCAEDGGGVFVTISRGIGSAAEYLSAELTGLYDSGDMGYGCEWYIITLLRGGKDIDGDILNRYYESAEATVAQWGTDTKPTDIERTALAMSVMGYDITDIGGVNIAELICNNPALAEGSNELAYALLAMDCRQTPVPEGALWDRELIARELLSFQAEDGSFGLYDSETGDTDMTAVCIQALAPYRDREDVAAALDSAVEFLRGCISDEYNYADNVNTTAQVLFALSALGIDVTDPANGFGDESANIITALDGYRNTEGNGYIYRGEVNTLATLQTMQAYDAYRKAHCEGISYWDFSAEGAVYDDSAAEDDTTDETTAADPVNVYVTIASDGMVVSSAKGGYMALAPVTVTDKDADGKLTVDEALYAAHEAGYEGGAEAGYASYNSPYGLSLAVLWGKGSIDAPATAGYWLNNASCWSLADEVREGDSVVAFNYYDSATWSDAFSYFEHTDIAITSAESATLQLKYLSGYDADNGYAPVFSSCSGAQVSVLGFDGIPPVVTDDNGCGVFSGGSVPDSGDYYLMASKADGSIVPAVCRISVTKVAAPVQPGYSGGFGGGGGTVSHTISFDASGGFQTKDIKVANNKLLSQPDDPVREGYIFDGWYTDEDFENKYDFDTKVTKDFTLYAKWVKIEEDKENPAEDKAFDESIFADVDKADWYYGGVGFVYENNLMNGTGAGFEPDTNITRAMFVTVLWRMEGQPVADQIPGFEDVAEDEWYTEAVNWAKVEGITSGVSEDKFGTNDYITREQLATLLYRYVQGKNSDDDASTGPLAFEDADDISDYAIDSLTWATENGVLQGDNGRVMPRQLATRAQTATMLMRLSEVTEG